MGKTQRREKDISTRREEILDAAEKIYVRHGFDAATMDMIAAEAEYAKQTLYAYFKGKEEIFSAVYLRSAKYVIRAFTERLENLGNASGFERLDAVREEFMRIAGSRPVYIQMMAAMQTKDLQELQDMGIYAGIAEAEIQMGNIFNDCIARGISDGSMKSGLDPLDASLFLKACVSGTLNTAEYNRQYLKQKLNLDPYNIMDKLLSMLMLYFKKSE